MVDASDPAQQTRNLHAQKHKENTGHFDESSERRKDKERKHQKDILRHTDSRKHDSGTPTGFHREGDLRPAGPPIANHADGVLQQPTASGKTTTPQQELYSSESKAAVFKNPDNEHRPSRVAKRLDT